MDPKLVCTPWYRYKICVDIIFVIKKHLVLIYKKNSSTRANDHSSPLVDGREMEALENCKRVKLSREFLKIRL